MVALSAERAVGASGRDPSAAAAGNAARRPASARGRRPAAVAGLVLPASRRSSLLPQAKAASASRRQHAPSRSGSATWQLEVGILDADIYGPSLPRSLPFARSRIPSAARAFGPIVLPHAGESIGFLIEEETPMIPRGPMVMSALTRCCAEWSGAPSMSVVDMPPGTGDAQLTMAQQVPLGAR